MDFIPFALPSIGEEEINEVVDTLRKGWLTTGEKTHLFEEQFAAYIGAPSVAVNSCTAALHLALIVANIQPGDEVITTPFTFAATGEVIAYMNAKPVFVDIDPATYNIDPRKIEEKITPKTKAIIPVHYGGNPCDMDAINAIAKKHNLIVIEDAAHAVGATYKGKMIGTIADLTAFSFYATKNLATGEGGMITTHNKAFEDRLRILRLHGISKDAWKRYTQAGTWKYEILEQGYKYNLTDMASSLGIHQLKKLNSFNATREKYAKMFTDAFKSVPKITLQKTTPNATHVWHLFTIQLDPSIDRDNFIEQLKQKNIGASVHFIPLHLHPFYQKTYHYKPGDFPVAERVYNGIISLPLFPAMSEEQVHYVANTVKELLK
jgi:dTDP-4-amino-4,6-dideoxygalactose transaminase